MSFSSFFSIIQTIVALGIVIILANLSLKFLKTNMTKGNKVIKIVERVSINNNSALAVVEICEKYYLMSFTNNDNKILKELDDKYLKEVILKMEEEQNLPYVNPVKKIKEYFGMRKEVD